MKINIHHGDTEARRKAKSGRGLGGYEECGGGWVGGSDWRRETKGPSATLRCGRDDESGGVGAGTGEEKQKIPPLRCPSVGMTRVGEVGRRLTGRSRSRDGIALFLCPRSPSLVISITARRDGWISNGIKLLASSQPRRLCFSGNPSPSGLHGAVLARTSREELSGFRHVV